MISHLRRPSLALFTLSLASGAALAQSVPTRPSLPPAPQMPAVKTPAPPAPAYQALPPRTQSPTAPARKAAPPPAKSDTATGVLQADHSHVYAQTDKSGTVWARGADYKMRFDKSGAAFIPFFGSCAPRNFDLGMQLVSVTAGGAAFELDAAAMAALTEDTVTIDRGDAREVYELVPESVEQKFVLERLPGEGDVHLRVAFESELTPSTNGRAWQFSNDYGRVDYGEATAVDANGRELALHGQLEGDEIEFVVPADFAARAALPLVIDPVITTYWVELGGVDTQTPDVVYDWSGGYVMHCWEELYSAGDHDVYSVITDVYGNPIGGTGGYVDYTTNYWARPHCAYQYNTDRYMFVAEVGPIGLREIWGQVRGPYFGYDSGQFQVSDSADYGEKLNCDVGGDPYPGPSYFYVVFEREWNSADHDILGRLVDGNGLPISTQYIENSGGTFDCLPAVSQTNNTDQWNIVWNRVMSAPNVDVYGARVLWQGAITATTFPLPAYFAPETNPSVSGCIPGTQRYVVAYMYDYTTDHDILAVLMDGSVAVSTTNLSFAEDPNYLFQDQAGPSVTCDGRHFACTYVENYGSSTTDYDAMICEFGFAGSTLAVDQGHVYAAYTFEPEVQTAVCAPYVSSVYSGPGSFTFDYSYRGTTVGGDDDIGSVYFSGNYGGPIVAFCGGTTSNCPCGNGAGVGQGCPNSVNSYGGYLLASGSASTVQDNLTLQYGGLLPNVSALLFQSVNQINFGTGNPFGDGLRCVGTPTFRFPLRTTDAYGFAQYGYFAGDVPVSVRGSVPYIGEVMNYQVWYRDPATYCTPARTNFTNALQVYWTP